MYKVYDYYEGKMLVGEAEGWLETKAIAKQFREDTDGECDIEIVYEPKKRGGILRGQKCSPLFSQMKFTNSKQNV